MAGTRPTECDYDRAPSHEHAATMRSQATRPLRLLTTAAFVAAIVPRLLQRGMFVDGVTYSSIARNLAEGRGRFWAPSYTATIYPEFYDHPPLGFWLQSLWFRLLGDHLFVERAYAATAAVVTALLIVRMWRRLHHRTAAGQHDWLPIALWIAVPVVSWAVVGNLLETTVAMFTTAAVAAMVEVGETASAGRSAGWGTVSGLCIVGAALTKGPVGLFPLAAPVVMFACAVGNRRSVSWFLASQWLTVAVCAAALLGSPEPRRSLTLYVDQQVLAALSGRREMSASSLTIVKALVQSVCAPMLLVTGTIALAVKRWTPPSRADRSLALAFIALGLAGTLPILASAKQAGHYLVPAVPFYAIGVAGLIIGSLPDAAERLSAATPRRAIELLSAAIFVSAAVAAFVPGFGRDRARLADLDALAGVVPRDAVIGICPAANADWGLHAWFERRFNVALDARGGRPQRWFLQTPDRDRACPPSACAPATDANRALVLLRCP